MTLRLVMVGIGGYGAHYLAEILKSAPEHGVELAAAVDPWAERSPLFEALRQQNVPVLPKLEAFYADGQADLVIVSAPIQQHAPLTCLALDHGAHVLCEKPLAGSLADVQQMMDAQKRAGKPVAVGFQWSFSPVIQAIKRHILAGRFGEPLGGKSLVLWPRAQSYYQRNAWAGRICTDDGSPVLDSPVNNATAHYLHNLLFLLGERIDSSAHPLEVEAQLYRANPIQNYDSAALRVQTSAGAPLLFYTAHPVAQQIGPLTELQFEKAVIEDSGTADGFRARFADGHVEVYGVPDNSPVSKLWSVVDSVRSSTPPACSIETALPHLLCVLAAQQMPIRDVPPDHVCVDDSRGDPLTYVQGLDAGLRACYEEAVLPSESADLPWWQE